MKAKTSKVILITRPVHQAQRLCQLISQMGAKAVSFPTICIKSIANKTTFKNTLQRLTKYDFAIFVSANAVSAVQSLWPKDPNSLPTIIAIGPGTARALEKNHIRVDAMPNEYNSEGIIALPQLKTVQNKSIVIFCGEKSRPFLKNELQKRGAQIDTAICYCRQCPIPTKKAITELRSNSIDLIVSTSQESLRNLAILLPRSENQWLYEKQLLVINSTMVTLAKQFGFTNDIIIAKNASDEAIAEASTNTLKLETRN